MLAGVALALAAVTGVELRAERDYQQSRAVGFLDPAKVSADEVERARERLERARSVRPGTTVMLLETLIETKYGEPADAVASARAAVEREPENFATWHGLLAVSEDAEEQSRARRELERLDPLRAER